MRAAITIGVKDEQAEYLIESEREGSTVSLAENPPGGEKLMPNVERVGIGGRLEAWSHRLLLAVVWLSCGLFGLYILSFYAAAFAGGALARWNKILPNLYVEEGVVANAGIGLHFAAGGLILMLGSIQFIERIRNRYPQFHRWTGRLYILAVLVAGLGGLIFILWRGTIGGPVMDIGFGLYGILMIVGAVQVWRHARAGRFVPHREWALRLYALAIGSWLYRIDYGLWVALTGGLGHASQFRGPFDKLMAFFFYLPNLVVVEVLLRRGKSELSGWRMVLNSALMLMATGVLLVGTWFFTRYYWGPAILALLSGQQN